jgi:hypothetical protein
MTNAKAAGSAVTTRERGSGSTRARRKLGLATLAGVLALAAALAFWLPGSSSSSTASDDGIVMSVHLDRTTVEPGGKIPVAVTIMNGRSTAVFYSVDCDSPATMSTTIPLPLDPSGKSWTGMEADLKLDAMGRGPVGDSTNEMQVFTYSGSCVGFQGERTLDPGATTTSTMTWSAEYVAGVPELPGDVPFSVTFVHDRTNGPPTYPPGYKGPIAAWRQEYKQLSVTGHIQIVGSAPHLLTKGQAVDAVLSDPTFSAWLREHPESTWSVVNMKLGNFQATSFYPGGPDWELDLFRENGVARNFASALVDPTSGVVKLYVCDRPCAG